MARKKRNIKARVLADSVYGSPVIARFINYAMISGKKAIAQKQIYLALNKLKDKKQLSGNAEVLEVFMAAVAAVKVSIELKPKRIGGATYQIPTVVDPVRASNLALRWIIDAARSRKEKDGFFARIFGELSDILEGRGETIKKKETIHKMAEANKAYSHLA